MSRWHPGLAKFTHRTISAYATPLASAHRTNITTVEGIGSTSSPHLLQTRLAACHAVQCGYDSHGTVVSTYGLLLNNSQPSMQQLETSQVGNISRCSGYSFGPGTLAPSHWTTNEPILNSLRED